MYFVTDRSFHGHQKMWNTGGSIPHRRTSINRDTCQEFPHISRGTVQKRRTAMCGAPNQLFLISKMTAWIIRATPESLPRPASPLSYPSDELSTTMWTSPGSIRSNDWILFCLNFSYVGFPLPVACLCKIHKYCIKSIYLFIR